MRYRYGYAPDIIVEGAPPAGPGAVAPDNRAPYIDAPGSVRATMAHRLTPEQLARQTAWRRAAGTLPPEVDR